MAYILFAHSAVSLGIGIGLVLTPKLDIGILPISGVIIAAYHWLCALIGFILAIAMALTQIEDAKANPKATGISIWSSALQALALLALAILQAFRPYSQWGGWAIFEDNWTVTINYLVVVGGLLITLWLRTQHLW